MSPELNKEIYSEIADSLAVARQHYKEAKDLLDLAREAGEDVGERMIALQEIKKKIDKWEAALKTRGYKVQ